MGLCRRAGLVCDVQHGAAHPAENPTSTWHRLIEHADPVPHALFFTGAEGVGAVFSLAPRILLCKPGTTDRWDRRAIELAGYAHAHGHCNVPEVSSGYPGQLRALLGLGRTRMLAIDGGAHAHAHGQRCNMARIEAASPPTAGLCSMHARQ